MIVSEIEINPPDFNDWPALLALLQVAFSKMEGRINPPSSLNSLSADDLAAKSRREDLFVIRQNGDPVACLFAVPQGDAYYLGKIATAPQHLRKGMARALIGAAASRARTLGLAALELQTRVELVENHATFAALGFVQTGSTAHPGFDRPTSLTYRRAL